MFYVIRYQSAAVADVREFPDIDTAQKEYGRQVYNAWRRKSVTRQVQRYYGHGPVIWWTTYEQGGVPCCIELSRSLPETPDWWEMD